MNRTDRRGRCRRIVPAAALAAALIAVLVARLGAGEAADPVRAGAGDVFVAADPATGAAEPRPAASEPEPGRAEPELADRGDGTAHDDDVLLIPSRPTDGSGAGAATDVPEGIARTIDVMVVYSPGAAARAGGEGAVRQDIAEAVAHTDAAFVASGVPARVELIATFPIQGGDGWTAGDALAALRTRDDGVFDEVHDLRRLVRADVVTMWADLAPGACGLSYLMGPDNVEPQTAEYAFDVVDDAPHCWRDRAAFAHELGHLLGADHDRAHPIGAAVKPYAHGLQHPGFRTIMAYGGGCADPCPVVPFYTTPHRSYRGRPVGDADHDNVRTFAHTAPVVAGYAEWMAAGAVTAVAVDDVDTYTVTGAGRVLTPGTPPRLGDLDALRLQSPTVGMAADPDGTGYWLVAADGGIFAFNATFSGSTGNLDLQAPIVGMAADPDGTGYWLVAADGGIFAFDAPFAGTSTAGSGRTVGMATTPRGYVIASSTGQLSHHTVTR